MMISIIIATTNRGSLIQTLESIAKQTYRDFELIVTDDTDGKARDRKSERYYREIQEKLSPN